MQTDLAIASGDSADVSSATSFDYAQDRQLRLLGMTRHEEAKKMEASATREEDYYYVSLGFHLSVTT